MNYKEFLKLIKTENFASAYLFYGEETFIGKLLIDNVIEQLFAPGFEVFNYNLFKDKETTAGDIVQACNTLPLGATVRLVVVQEEVGVFERNTEADHKVFSAYFKDPAPHTLLIFTLTKGDKRKKIYQTLSEKCVTVRLDKLSETDLTNWIAARIKKENKRIDKVTLKKLVWRLKYLENKEMTITAVDNKVQQLINYSGDNNVITMEDVQKTIPSGIEENIFKMLDYSLQGKAAEAIAVSKELIAKGESPFGMLGLVVRQIRLMLMTKLLLEEGIGVAAIAKTSGVPQYVAEKNCRSVANKPLSLLLNNFFFIQDLDIKMKTGGIEAEKGIEWALLNLLKR